MLRNMKYIDVLRKMERKARIFMNEGKQINTK